MNGRPEQAELSALWVEKAEEDRRVFMQLLKMGEDCPVNAVCFHAQQCAEKYLKAHLVFLGIEFPKTHDIGRLSGLLPPGIRIPLSGVEQELLTDYSWMGRYPGTWEPVNRVQAEEAAGLAGELRSAVRDALPKEVTG